jgi:hypothetical protein
MAALGLVAGERIPQKGLMIIALSPGERGDPPWRVGEGLLSHLGPT